MIYVTMIMTFIKLYEFISLHFWFVCCILDIYDYILDFWYYLSNQFALIDCYRFVRSNSLFVSSYNIFMYPTICDHIFNYLLNFVVTLLFKFSRLISFSIFKFISIISNIKSYRIKKIEVLNLNLFKIIFTQSTNTKGFRFCISTLQIYLISYKVSRLRSQIKRNKNERRNGSTCSIAVIIDWHRKNR